VFHLKNSPVLDPCRVGVGVNGAITVRLQCDYDAITVRIQCDYSADTVRIQCDYSAITMRLQCDYSAITLRIRCEYSANTVRLQCKYSAITVRIQCLGLGLGVTMAKFHFGQERVRIDQNQKHLKPLFDFREAILPLQAT